MRTPYCSTSVLNCQSIIWRSHFRDPIRVESIERNDDSKNGARNVHICTHLHKISTLMFSSTYLLAINVLWRNSKGNSLRSNAIFERGQLAFVPCHFTRASEQFRRYLGSRPPNGRPRHNDSKWRPMQVRNIGTKQTGTQNR